jgi:hypothetical protein
LIEEKRKKMKPITDTIRIVLVGGGEEEEEERDRLVPRLCPWVKG